MNFIFQRLGVKKFEDEEDEELEVEEDQKMTTLPTVDAFTMFELEEESSPMIWIIVGCAIGVCFIGLCALLFVLIWKKRSAKISEENPEGEYH